MGRPRSKIDIGEADREAAPRLLHRVRRVCGEVHEDLLDLGRIGDDRVRCRPDVQLHTDGARQRAAKELVRLLDQGRQPQGVSSGLGLSAEGQDLLDQIPCALAMPSRSARCFFWAVVARDVVEGQFRVAEDNGKHVIEIVRYPARQSPYCLHFLGLP